MATTYLDPAEAIAEIKEMWLPSEGNLRMIN